MNNTALFAQLATLGASLTLLLGLILLWRRTLCDLRQHDLNHPSADRATALR